MALYPYALFLHILGVLGLFIAIGLEWTAIFRMRTAQTTATVREWMRVMGALDMMIPMTALLILAAGLYMTITVWGWSHGWIDVSLVAFLINGALGPAVISPRMKAIHKAAELAADGPLPANLKQLIHNPVLRTTTYAMGFSALGIVCLMTTKQDWIASLAIMVVAIIIGIAASRISPRAHRVAQTGEQLALSHTVMEEANVQ